MITFTIGNGYQAVLSDEDVDLAEKYWYPKESDGRLYPRNRRSVDGQAKYEYMHRIVMARKLGRPLTGRDQVDHINNNPLDNRRENLRLCTTQQNSHNRGPTQANKSGYKGVCWHPQGKWMAYIFVDGKNITLGYFDDPEEAACARDDTVREHQPEFGYLNFPD